MFLGAFMAAEIADCPWTLFKGNKSIKKTLIYNPKCEYLTQYTLEVAQISIFVWEYVASISMAWNTGQGHLVAISTITLRSLFFYCGFIHQDLKVCSRLCLLQKRNFIRWSLDWSFFNISSISGVYLNSQCVIVMMSHRTGNTILARIQHICI